jgi:putative flippase GtrA
MKFRIQRFLVVGIIATALDVSFFVFLHQIGWSLVLANVLALNAAALLAWPLHRLFTLADDPFTRWIGSPGVFGFMVVTAGLVDTGVVYIFNPDREVRAELLAKLIAVVAAALVRAISYRIIIFRTIRREQDQPTNRPVAEGDYRLTVVIPAYREVDRIKNTIERIRSELGPKIDNDLEVIVVDDGSKDGTEEAAGLADQLIVLPRNQGKGSALRNGVDKSNGRVVAFTDADLAYSPSQIFDLLVQVENGYDWVVGNRHHVDTRTIVRAGFIRGMGGRLVNFATHLLLLGQYRDTQCGLKAFRSDVAKSLFSSSTINGFAFDVELFHLAERWRLSLSEISVEVEHSERTTVRVVQDGFRLLRDLIHVRRLASQGSYPVDPQLPKASKV